MKHWIEFLEKRTHEAKRLGKRVNALDFEVLEARQNLEMYEKQRNEVEAQIYNLIEPLYIDNTECTEAILQAKEKANKYNSEPMANHTPTPKKEKRNSSNDNSTNEVQS